MRPMLEASPCFQPSAGVGPRCDLGSETKSSRKPLAIHSFCDEDQTENIRATSGSSESASRFGTRPREKAHSTTKRGSPLPCGPKRRSVFRGSETALLGRNQASWTYSAEGSVVVAQLAGSRKDVVKNAAAALLALVLLRRVEARVDGAAVHDAGRAGLAVDRNLLIIR